MIQYKVLKGTRRTLYLKGLKSKYFYVFCFAGSTGAMLIVFTGLNNGIVLHLVYAVLFMAGLYAVLFFLSMETPYKRIRKKYDVIRNVDLIKILMK